ncbi:MAG: hypothetical protein AVDCRST_MAG89-4713 [uncultured Gemmatimonadetes bacterium]|uniref:Transmembrane protein (PGPGW) n=1 Tax=uncultured Gemmatimonadota bacterium TaxID=203437 RepID=A0A6J4MYJ8_9BACT|nr:MAG: hypothetical protein AVDCRST_MAG89-4713 [uncultured Gemmatimonadota bacterium]
MLKKIKRSWHELKEGEPGKRFQDRYDKRQQDGGSGWKKPVFIGGGALIFAAGIFFLPAPGPGFLIIFLGAGLIAPASRFAARMLDRAELLIRRVAGWGLRVWKRSPIPVKALIVLLGLALAAGAAYLAYRWFFAK